MSTAQDGLRQALERYEKASSKVGLRQACYITDSELILGGTRECASTSTVITQSRRRAGVIIAGN